MRGLGESGALLYLPHGSLRWGETGGGGEELRSDNNDWRRLCGSSFSLQLFNLFSRRQWQKRIYIQC